MSGSEQPSREELLALIEAQARTIERLQVEIAELKRRLGRNSSNSSQPPSTDGPAVSPSRAARRRSARRPGKQPGAGGSALFQTSDPDEIVDHVPDACGGCGSDLAGASPAGVVRRQVHDIPTITPVVVEHRLHKRRCGCGATTTATAPAGVGAAAVYGPNLRALAVYLLVFQHIPVARTATLIADLTGARPSTGWISSVLTTVADLLIDVEKLIKSLIVLAHVIHVDETSSNINGARWWLHVASTEKLTAYHLHPSRGRAAVTEFDVLPAFRGTVVHDALSVYDAYPERPARPVRCAPGPRARRRQRGRPRPGLARRRRYVPCTGSTPPPTTPVTSNYRRSHPRSRNPCSTRGATRCWSGSPNTAASPDAANPRPATCCERLRDRDHQVLLFARDLTVPFTNNQAERDVRPTKTQMKISGCHRSETTAKAWLRVRGYISTVAQARRQRHGRAP